MENTNPKLKKTLKRINKELEEIEKDEDAKKKLGWVREMYAYSIAAATSNVKHIVEEPRKTMLISQPPADDNLYGASMYHYTWGARYVEGNDKSSIVWDWDKRPYVDVKHVREPAKYMPPMPPESIEEGGDLKLLDGTLVTSKLNDVMRDLIGTMRNAIQRLDTLDYNCGWLDTEPKCDFDVKPASCVNLFAPRATSFIHHPLFLPWCTTKLILFSTYYYYCISSKRAFDLLACLPSGCLFLFLFRHSAAAANRLYLLIGRCFS